MKCVKKTVRHYWKYQYTTWTQPVLTGDSSYGDLYCDTLNSGFNPYKMFDGNLQDNASRFESNTQPDLVEWFLPYNEYIKVTAIDFYNKYTGDNYGTKTLQLYAGENRTKPLTDVVTVTVGTRALTHIDIPVENQTFSNVFAIDFITKQGNNLGAQEVYITAQKRTVVAGTESDYDYYTDDEITLLPKETVRHYWKNVEKTWVQPVLTDYYSSPLLQPSATSESSGKAWMAFNNNEADHWGTPDGVTTATLTAKFNKQLKITKVVVIGRWADSSYHLTSATINGITKNFTSSSDITQTFDFEEPYVTSDMPILATGKGWIGIKEVYITATYIEAEPATQDDYDFYTDDEVYFGINQ